MKHSADSGFFNGLVLGMLLSLTAGAVTLQNTLVSQPGQGSCFSIRTARASSDPLEPWSAPAARPK